MLRHFIAVATNFFVNSIAVMQMQMTVSSDYCRGPLQIDVLY